MESRQILLLGRWMYGALFILTGVTHLTPGTQSMAAQHGVPAWMTVCAGFIACAGGLSVALGYRARAGAWLIVAFLVPVTLTMHRFWGLADPAQAMGQFAHFMKNVSMMGGALMVSYFGSGPLSLDTRPRAGSRTIESVRHREPALR